jgi:hypothetical protein
LIKLESAADDKTQINAIEKPVPKSKFTNDRQHPNWGSKRDTNGNQIKWFGWKYHLICDTIWFYRLDIMLHLHPFMIHKQQNI